MGNEHKFFKGGGGGGVTIKLLPSEARNSCIGKMGGWELEVGSKFDFRTVEQGVVLRYVAQHSITYRILL